MARLRNNFSADTDGHSTIYRDPSTAPPPRIRSDSHESSSRRATFSESPDTASDKENRRSTSGSKKMSSSHRTSPTPAVQPHNHPHKRRRLSERDRARTGPPGSEEVSDDENDHEASVDSGNAIYDPDQSIEDRREIRKGLRELTKTMNESSTEFLRADNHGLLDTVDKANAIFANVKQTSDATIDSGLLVRTGDLTYKKTTQLKLGDSSAQIGLDDFVSKCVSFMRAGDVLERTNGAHTSSSQWRRRTATRVADDDEDDVDDGRGLNWEWLGRQACMPNNIRPPTPAFLLGPLSVQKRMRQPRARRERLQRATAANTTRPEELKPDDIERQENNNLTAMCKTVHRVLSTTLHQTRRQVEQLYRNGKEDEADALVQQYGLSENGGANLFNFAFHPQSFGQTVENLFYVSFLVREGAVWIGKDPDTGLPTLHDQESDLVKKAKATSSQPNGNSAKTNQAVFSIDFDTWRELVDILGMQEPVIPDRPIDEAAEVVASRGWYG